MAMSKPVITTKIPGIMKEFKEGNGVFYVDKPEDTIEKSKIAYENAINEYKQRARRLVERYNWDDITNEFEKELSNLIIIASLNVINPNKS